MEEASEHVTFLTNPNCTLLLLFVYSPLVCLDFLLLEVIALQLPFSFADGRFILIDVLQFLLIFHEVIVILFVNRVLLCLYLAANHHFLVIILLLSFLLFLLPGAHLLAHGQFFKGGLFLLRHQLILT